MEVIFKNVDYIMPRELSDIAHRDHTRSNKGMEKCDNCKFREFVGKQIGVVKDEKSPRSTCISDIETMRGWDYSVITIFCKRADVILRHVVNEDWWGSTNENKNTGYCSLWEDCYTPRKRLTKKQRKLVYDKYGGHCAYCGCELDIKDMQADHIQSYYHGGSSDDINNYNPACRDCNFYKGVGDLERFREWLLGAYGRWKRYKLELTGRIVKKYGLTGEEKEIKFYFEKVKE